MKSKRDDLENALSSYKFKSNPFGKYDPMHYHNESDEMECTFKPKTNINSSKMTKRYQGSVNDITQSLYKDAFER